MTRPLAAALRAGQQRGWRGPRRRALRAWPRAEPCRAARRQHAEGRALRRGRARGAARRARGRAALRAAGALRIARAGVVLVRAAGAGPRPAGRHRQPLEAHGAGGALPGPARGSGWGRLRAGRAPDRRSRRPLGARRRRATGRRGGRRGRPGRPLRARHRCGACGVCVRAWCALPGDHTGRPLYAALRAGAVRSNCADPLGCARRRRHVRAWQRWPRPCMRPTAHGTRCVLSCMRRG